MGENGLEPLTFRLSNEYSAIELRARNVKVLLVQNKERPS